MESRPTDRRAPSKWFHKTLSPHLKRLVYRFGWIILGTASVVSIESVRVGAQAFSTASVPEQPATCRPPQLPNVGTFPNYELRRRSRSDLENLRACLRTERWGDALRVFFPDSRREGFVNWVVYLDRDGRVFQAVTEGEGRRTEFRGEKYVWVIVFLDRPPTRYDTMGNVATVRLGHVIPAGDSALLASRRSVNYQRDALLGSLFKFVVGKFLAGGDPPGTPSALVDSTRLMELRRLSASDDDTMYVGQTRFGIGENTHVVLSIAPGLTVAQFRGPLVS